MGRAPCCDEKLGLKKGPWTPDEDQKLVIYIQQHGHGSWRALPEKAGLGRCGKSCRLRWTNYLRPDIKRGQFSYEEDQVIIQLHAILGNRWSAIASHLPRRTDNEIKNYWNTHLKKRFTHAGLDLVTDKISSAARSLTSTWTPRVSPHMTEWDRALAEAEARLSKTSLIKPFTKFSTTVPASTHPSAFFMNSWKTEVEDTLRPKFGTVKLEPQLIKPYDSSPFPARIHALQDWNTALGLNSPQALFSQNAGAMAESNALGAASSSTSLGMFMLESEIFFPTNSAACELSGAGRSDIYSSSLDFQNQISPTSILHGPDSDFASSESSSPCDSTSGTSDCFDHILHQNCSSYQNFPLIPDHTHHQESSPMALPDTFWQHPQSAMVETMQPDVPMLADAADADSETNLELVLPLDFNIGEFPPVRVSVSRIRTSTISSRLYPLKKFRQGGEVATIFVGRGRTHFGGSGTPFLQGNVQYSCK